MSAFSESPTAVPWKDPATQRASMIIVRTYWGRFLCIQRLAGVSRRSHSPPSVTKDTERLGSLCGSVTSNLGVWLWLYAFRQASQSPGWEIPILRAVVWEDWILNYSNTQVRQRLHLSTVPPLLQAFGWDALLECVDLALGSFDNPNTCYEPHAVF